MPRVCTLQVSSWELGRLRVVETLLLLAYFFFDGLGLPGRDIAEALDECNAFLYGAASSTTTAAVASRLNTSSDH